jgi:hypothetical protein
MSLLPNISNLFRPTQQVTVTPQPANPMQGAPVPPGGTMQPNNPAAGTGSGQSGAPNLPAPQPGTDPQQQTSQNPADTGPSLDNWKTVWDTPPADKTPTDPWSQPILPSDPAKIREAAGKMDMLSGVNPELMQKAMSGSDPQAFMQVINAVAQNTLAMSAQLSSASVERAGSVIRERTEQSLPEKFRDFQLNQLPVDNPVLNHPGAQGLLRMTRQQLKMQNPTWNAQQINDEAVKYLTTFAAATTHQSAPAVQQRTSQQAQEGTDWSTFLDS